MSYRPESGTLPEPTLFRPPKIIGLSGWAQVGKDTVGAALVEHHGYTRRSFADAVRQAALIIDPLIHFAGMPVRLSALVASHGWEQTKQDPEVRRFLQVLGTDFGRQFIADNVWVDKAMATRRTGELSVFTDVRFPNEFWAVRDAGGIVVRIERPGVEAVNNHVSEHALDDFDFDVRLTNDGSIEDLDLAVTFLMHSPVILQHRTRAERDAGQAQRPVDPPAWIGGP